MRIVICLAVLITSIASAYADVYRWEDKDGMHFTDNMGSIPKKYRKKAISDSNSEQTVNPAEVKPTYSTRQDSANEASGKKQDYKVAAYDEKAKTGNGCNMYLCITSFDRRTSRHEPFITDNLSFESAESSSQCINACNEVAQKYRVLRPGQTFSGQCYYNRELLWSK